jgi:serine/threonine protein kinase
MKLHEGKSKIYETSWGKEEALHFQVNGNEHWVKRNLNGGRYEVCGLLAIGGLGCVFLANDRWNYNHKVAIKTPYYMGDYCRPYVARSQLVFERQVKSLNKLYELEQKYLVRFSNAGFDSIVNLNDYFVDRSLDLCQPFRDAAGVQYFVCEDLHEHAPYLVIKYIRGDMLKDVLAQKPLSQSQTLRLAKQILVLMRHMHEQRKTKKGRSFYYLLCDLKADNIIVTDNEQITLIDFGAVKVHWLDQQEIELPIFVTDGYAGPEVYSGSIEMRDNPRIDQRFDVFTMGALMVHCLSGKHPAEFLVNYAPPQHDFRVEQYSHIARPVQDIIRKAIAHERQERYADVDAMLYDMERAFKELKC